MIGDGDINYAGYSSGAEWMYSELSDVITALERISKLQPCLPGPCCIEGRIAREALSKLRDKSTKPGNEDQPFGQIARRALERL